jgi:hypothetical protein
MTFIKGKSGNPRGRGRDKPFLDALRLEIAASGEDAKLLRKIGAKVLKRAEAGDMGAISFLADRLDGKPVQGIENADPYEPFNVAPTSPADGLSLDADDSALLAEIIALVKRTVPRAGDRPPGEVFAVIRRALREHFGDVEAALNQANRM